ncbi:hypothetical protein BDV35DRAFT_361462 [Aspergillus flavus]|uniref:Uncharacterized protein n=1 Tax=Aspergillus flavus TaxID=5059 RepID=A0A5N6GSC3_ASPFL|nr:hypothetical protein BDV35DRAFT_361462 [Aspergillus flavus]
MIYGMISVEAIIAIVALLVSCPPSILMIWKYFRRPRKNHNPNLEYGVIEYEAHPTLPPFPHYQHNASIEQLLVLQFHQRMEKITITPNQVDALTLIRSQILSACT